MDKSTHFFGQSVFGQLISLIDPAIISESSKQCKSDRYVKRFTTKDHLISMLFCTFAKCTSLREVSGAMLGLSGKTKHFQIHCSVLEDQIIEVKVKQASGDSTLRLRKITFHDHGLTRQTGNRHSM
jgi:hypothetical protein